MKDSKTATHIQSATSSSENSAAGEKHTSARCEASARDASTVSRDKAVKQTKYRSIFANIAKVMCQNGAAYWQLALAFQVDEDTIREWARTYKDFAAGCKYGRNFADDTVERSLYQLARGYDHRDVKIFHYQGQTIYAPYTKHVVANVQACIFWLINRRPYEWGEPKPDAKADGSLMKLYYEIYGRKIMPKHRSERLD